MTYQTSLSVSNSTDRQVIFHLEPWGEQIPMSANLTFQVVAEAKERGELEVEIGQTDILVWAWPGSTITVWCDGKEVGDVPGRKRPRVPAIPQNESFFLSPIHSRQKEEGEKQVIRRLTREGKGDDEHT